MTLKTGILLISVIAAVSAATNAQIAWDKPAGYQPDVPDKFQVWQFDEQDIFCWKDSWDIDYTMPVGKPIYLDWPDNIYMPETSRLTTENDVSAFSEVKPGVAHDISGRVNERWNAVLKDGWLSDDVWNWGVTTVPPVDSAFNKGEENLYVRYQSPGFRAIVFADRNIETSWMMIQTGRVTTLDDFRKYCEWFVKPSVISSGEFVDSNSTTVVDYQTGAKTILTPDEGIYSNPLNPISKRLQFNSEFMNIYCYPKELYLFPGDKELRGWVRTLTTYGDQKPELAMNILLEIPLEDRKMQRLSKEDTPERLTMKN